MFLPDLNDFWLLRDKVASVPCNLRDILAQMEPTESIERVGELMQRFRQGDRHAAGELVELLYSDLRHMAARKMAQESSGHSWQPTLLVHELYLQLIRFKSFPSLSQEEGIDPAKEKAIFLKLAGLMMQRRLIDHAKPRFRRMPKLELATAEIPLEGMPEMEELLHVESLLHRLSEIDSKFRVVVEGRVFLGLTLDEIAQQLECSGRTAATYWSFARRWLADELDRTVDCPPPASWPNRPS